MPEDSAFEDISGRGGHSQETQEYKQPNKYLQTITNFYNLFDRPVTWFRESIVVPNQKYSAWYHRVYRRVPTIDECYTDDAVCIYEAEEQFSRDQAVETEILSILRNRRDDCIKREYPDHKPHCIKVAEAYDEAAGHWFTKYGDLGHYTNAKRAFMKQKHRLLWERRHGPVGTGMNKGKYDVSDVEH